MNSNNKTIFLVLGIIITLYIADAIYPHWEFECHSTNKLGLNIGPAEIHELQGPDNPRVMNPSHPNGCELIAQNTLRKQFDKVVALYK